MVSLNMTTGPVNALQTINNLTVAYGIPLFGTSILVFIWIIVYMRSRERSPRAAIAGASFFTMVIGIIFMFLGLVPDIVGGFLIGICILSYVPIINT